MAKKLLGERQIGEAVYTAGQILSDDEFAKSGLTESDVATVGETPAAPAAQATPAAQADKDAAIDVAAEGEKNGEQQSAPAGSEATSSENGGEGGAVSSEVSAEAETVEHTLTEQDLADNPDLAAQGHKAGDVVRVPKGEVQA